MLPTTVLKGRVRTVELCQLLTLPIGSPAEGRFCGLWSCPVGLPVSLWYGDQSSVTVRFFYNVYASVVPFILQVIYVARNPKDVLVSYFHFSKTVITPDNPPDFSIFMERFLAGEGNVFFLKCQALFPEHNPSQR